MTVAAAGASATGRSRIVAVLLAVSLALNLCFIAGAAWVRLNPPAAAAGSAERAREMAAQLGLDPQQQVAFDRYIAGMREHIRQMHLQVGPTIGAAWAELAKPGADEATVMQRFDDAAQKRRDFQQQLTTETLAFLATLSPEQRSKFVELARRRPNPWSPEPEHQRGR